MAEKLSKLRLLFLATALAVTACGGSDDNTSTPPSPPPPPPASGNVPTISSEVKAAADKIVGDAAVKSIVAEWNTASNAQERFNQHMELTRIASPSREEYNRAAEIERRLLEEWGFSRSEIKTRADGHLAGSDVQVVDGLPVYNVCVEIKGTYSSTPGAQTYKGQYPKVVVEGHIDTVNPEKLTYRYEPVKLQPWSQAVVTTPAELAAIPLELSFDNTGRIVQNALYDRARVSYATAAAATAADAFRIYVPGISDAMGNTSGVFNIAKAMKKYKVTPVYDMWFCGTAGEEGKGNLAGMKQLYGYDQGKGTGTNPLNVVTNFSIDGGSGTVNFLGSYRFEMRYTAPTGAGANSPSALEAAAAAITKIADLKTPWDTNPQELKTTYTVGVVSCEAPATGSAVVPSCSIQVDMRSPRIEPLNEIRKRIEPLFQAGATEANARYNVADGSAGAVKVQLDWFGDRPPHERTNLSDVSIQSAWQAAEVVGVDKRTELSLAASSLNDNVPAAIGVPTINLNISTSVGGGGGHAFWEWATLGSSATEGLRMQRVLAAALIAAGYNAADGSVVKPAAPAMGARTAEVK